MSSCCLSRRTAVLRRLGARGRVLAARKTLGIWAEPGGSPNLSLRIKALTRMGKKSRRKPAKPPRAPNTPDTAAGGDDQDWWINGEAVPEADFVARTYEEIVSDPNHNDYP